MSANSRPFGTVPSVFGEGFSAAGNSHRCFTFGTNNQSAQNSNLFGRSSNPGFGTVGSATHFGTSGFGSNSAPGGLFGPKPFPYQSSSPFGSSATAAFGTTLSCGNLDSSKTGIGKFGSFSFGSNSVPGLFSLRPFPAQSSSPFGNSATATFGVPSSCGNFGSKTGIGHFGGFSFGTTSAPSVFGTNSQSAQNRFPFGKTTTPGFGSSGFTTTGFDSPCGHCVFGTNSQSSQRSFPFGQSSTASCGSFGSTSSGFGSASTPFVFGTVSQSAHSPFSFGKAITPGFGISGPTATGCASTFTTPSFPYGTNSSAWGSKVFGRSSTPSFGSTFGSAAANTSYFGTPGGLGAAPVGTTIKFNPTTGTDTMMKGGVSTNVSVRNQCITAMKEYESKSLEELRFEDYAAGRKGPQTRSMSISHTTGQSRSVGQFSGPSVSIVFGNSLQSKSSTSDTDGAISDLIKGMVTNLNLPADQKVVVFTIGTVIINKGSGGMDMMEESMSLNFNTPQKCVTCMKDYENKSLEGQQVEDCACNRKQLYPRPNFRGFSTTRRRALFAKRRGATTSFTLGNATQWKPGSDVSAALKGTTVRFFAPTETETVVKPSETANIQTRYQCITCMKEYENKSLEELRTEDYAADRKGTQMHERVSVPILRGCCSV